MSKYFLKDLFDKPISGEWGKELEDGINGFPVIRTTNFTNIGEINYDDLTYRNIDVVKKENKFLKQGDIIIEKSGGTPDNPVGRVVYFKNKEKNFFTNNFTAALRAKSNFDSKYLFYLLFYLHKRKVVLKYQNKTTGIINLQLNDYLKKTEVDIPTLCMQKETVDLLDGLRNLLKIRKEQIQVYDDLIESLFFDMLQSELMSDNIEYSKLGDLTSHISSGSTPRGGSSVYKSEGIPLIRSQDVKMNNLDYSNVVYIDTETHDKMKRSKLKNRDVLLNITGASIGRTAVFYGEDDSANTNQHVAAIRLKDEKVSPEFLSFYFSTEYFQAIIKNISSGGTREALNYKQIREFDIPLISKIEQEKFIKNKEKIEEEKKKLNSSLKELENLFDALMQDAFSGNLFKD